MTRYRSDFEIFISPDHHAKEEIVAMNDRGHPDPPAGRPAAVADPSGSLSAMVTWSSPPYDGGRCVDSYRVECHSEPDESWRVVVEGCHSLSVVVRDLAPGRRHVFRVRAENVHGLSEPSAQSQPFCTPTLAESDEDPPPPPFSPRHVTVEPLEEFRARFEVLEELGKGRYGVVHRVTEAATKQTLAAKFIRTIKAKDRQQVHDEIAIMNILRHPKLLQLAAAFEGQREVVMIMEYISGGELFERVVADDFTLTERDCILFMRQICEGVDYMHQNQVVHLDLKPENIMCQTRTSHLIKLIDFGLAQKLKPDTPVRVLFGTPEFIPPEIINYEPIGTETDMWSVGVICYVLLSGLSPFMGDNDAETFANITRADFDFDDEAFDAISQDARDFISALLVKRKEKRLTAKQCLEHAWLAQQPANMSCIALSTDKLKKFIIRRKWQKTGNAIRALGRMATLSAASRRNSTASSTAGTPRQSLSGYPHSRTASLSKDDNVEDVLVDATQRLARMTEEDGADVVQEEALTATLLPRGRFQSERSDSGISDCSSASSRNQPSQHPTGLLRKKFSISEEVDESETPSEDLPDALPDLPACSPPVTGPASPPSPRPIPASSPPPIPASSPPLTSVSSLPPIPASSLPPIPSSSPPLMPASSLPRIPSSSPPLMPASSLPPIPAPSPPARPAPSPPASPAPSPPASPAPSPPASPAPSPPASPASLPPTSPASLPPTSPASLPPTSPASLPPASPASLPPASPASSPPASPASSPPASPASSPPASPASSPPSLSQSLTKSAHDGTSTVSRRSAELLLKFGSNSDMTCFPTVTTGAAAATASVKAAALTGTGAATGNAAGLNGGADPRNKQVPHSKIRSNGVGMRSSSRATAGFVESKIKSLESQNSSKSIQTPPLNKVHITVAPPTDPSSEGTRASDARVSLRDTQRRNAREHSSALSPSRRTPSTGRSALSPSRIPPSPNRKTVSPNRTAVGPLSKSTVSPVSAVTSPRRAAASPLRRVDGSPARTPPYPHQRLASPVRKACVDQGLRPHPKEPVIGLSPPKSPTLRRMRIDGMSPNKLGTHSAGFQKTLEFWKR